MQDSTTYAVKPTNRKFHCKYLLSDGSKRRFLNYHEPSGLVKAFENQNELFLFPQSLMDIPNAKMQQSVLDPWPAQTGSRQRSNGLTRMTKQGRLEYQAPEQSKLPPVYKPKILESLEAKIVREKKRLGISEDKYDPSRLQVYREVFDLFIANCVYYGPLLAKIKAEYESHIQGLNEELKALYPIKEMLWTVSEECEQRINETRMKENTEIIHLKTEKKRLMAQIYSLKEEIKHLNTEVEHLTQELVKQADDWRTEADGRKLLVTEVNELTSRLKEMEALVRAEIDENTEDSTKLRIAFEQSKVMIRQLQTKLTEFITQYESTVVRSKYEDVKQKLAAQENENTKLQEEMASMQARYDLLQDHCLSLSTYRDIYYIQVTYAQRIFSAKGDSNQKVEFISMLLNRWRKMLADKSWNEMTRIVADELLKLESGNMPVMVRASKGKAGASVAEKLPSLGPNSGSGSPEQ